MKITAKEIAQIVDGEVDGDPYTSVTAPAGLEEAQEGNISFLSNMKYEPYVYSTQASILLVDKTYQPEKPINPTLIRVDNVYASIAHLLDQFKKEPVNHIGISPMAVIDSTANIADDVSVEPFTVIKEHVAIGVGTRIASQVYIAAGVKIGNNCVLYPGVKIYEDCVIGDHTIIHSNAVIGADGFGFSKGEDHRYSKIAQIGNVVIGRDVEIGANTTIDRATMGSTEIRDGVKLDNLIQVGHNVIIGENTVIAAQTAIAGSTEIGKGCMIGGQVAIVGHIKVADGTQIQGKSGVTKASKPGQKLFGIPAIDFNTYMRAYSVFKKLPEIYRNINTINKQLQANDPD